VVTFRYSSKAYLIFGIKEFFKCFLHKVEKFLPICDAFKLKNLLVTTVYVETWRQDALDDIELFNHFQPFYVTQYLFIIKSNFVWKWNVSWCFT
jgi:hypothetical protein